MNSKLPHQVKDIRGLTFGCLAVLEYAGLRGATRKRTHWHCRCECGNTTVVATRNLRSGNTKSCGCGQPRTTHGMCYQPEYQVWGTMKDRCNNPNNQCSQYYGGRGITYCPQWAKFENFFADMGPRPSSKHVLARIDTDGNYEPSNCRWLTRAEHTGNSRNTRLITFGGHTRSVTGWAKEMGMKRITLSQRLRNGWTIERALTQPVQYHRGYND